MGKGQTQRIPAQRRAELLALLRRRGAAPISELAEMLETSESTVRRDLDRLDAEGVVRRTHGGALVVEHHTTFEPRFEDRCLHNPEEKERIGRHAAAMLEPGQSVLFDSSSTVLSAARALLGSPIRITAVTNDVSIASALAAASEVSVVVTGGEIRPGSFTLLGPGTQSFLDRLHVDIALIGIHAISGTELSEGGLAVAETKRSMISAARRVVLLADHSKFGEPAFFEVASVDAVQDLITDRSADPEALDAIHLSAPTRIHVV